MSVLGKATAEVGFVIKDNKGTVIFNRTAGTTFATTTIFKVFCPTTTCSSTATVSYSVSLSDQYGDGWEGTVLAFRQNGTLTPFGANFTSGATYPAATFTFKKYINVDIIVYKLGTFTK